MEKLKLFNGTMGKLITEANLDDDVATQLMEIMDIPFGDVPAWVNEQISELPKPFLKLKVSTVLDIFLNLGDEGAIEELQKYFEEEDEPD